MKTGGRFTLQHPLAPQFRVRPEVGLISKEYLCASPLSLLPQGGVLHHEGLPFGLVRLEQPLLGPLEGKPQAVQPVQATATAQTGAESFPDKLPDSFPVPVGQLDTCLLRQLLHRRLQLLPLPLVKRGGDPPDCSNIRAAGPPSPKADAHRPMVCGSAPAPPPSPLPSSPGPAARRRTTAPAPGAWAPGSSAGARPWHPSKSRCISLAPITNPSLTPGKANSAPSPIYPMFLRISPWLWFRYLLGRSAVLLKPRRTRLAGVYSGLSGRSGGGRLGWAWVRAKDLTVARHCSRAGPGEATASANRCYTGQTPRRHRYRCGHHGPTAALRPCAEHPSWRPVGCHSRPAVPPGTGRSGAFRQNQGS